MPVINDNLGSFPVNARGLALAVQKDEDLYNLSSCVKIAQDSMLSNIH